MGIVTPVKPPPRSSGSYVFDVDYVSKYNPLLNPANINFICALKGQCSKQLDGHFNYLDLGCGSGATLNTLAGLYPDARFTGIDLNENHIRTANDQAKHAGLLNTEFHQIDFHDLHEHDFGDLDFITCFGTLSWVNPTVQDEIIRFAGKNLKPGGSFLVHYSASPGEVQVDPMWYFMRSITKHIQGNSIDRARYGIEMIGKLHRNGAAFFKQNPIASHRAASLKKRSLEYWAHEALTKCQILRHGDVSNRLSAAGLAFLGHANPELNFNDLCVPEVFQSITSEANDTETRELLIDFITNKDVRVEIYIKGRPASNALSPVIDDIPFGILSADKTFQHSYKCKSGIQIHYSEPVFHDIFDELKTGAKIPKELFNTERMSSYQPGNIINAICRLVAGRQVQPFARRTAIETLSLPHSYFPATTFIRDILLSDIRMDRLVYLPYMQSGQCIQLRPMDALLLSATLRQPVEGILEWTVSQMNMSGSLLDSTTNQPVKTVQMKNIVADSYENVRNTILPNLYNLGLFINQE